MSDVRQQEVDILQSWTANLPIFRANHLHMSKYSYQDKSKHIKEKKGTLLVDMRQTKRRLCLSSLLVHELLFLIKLTVVMMMMMMMIVIMIQ